MAIVAFRYDGFSLSQETIVAPPAPRIAERMSPIQFDDGHTPGRDSQAVALPSTGKATVTSSLFSPSWVG